MQESDGLNVVAKLIKCDAIDGKHIAECEKNVYEMVNYYEMNLYYLPVDEHIKQDVDVIHQKNQANTCKFKGEITSIAKVLEENNVEYCILAGIPMTARYHDRPERRLQEDIDFFVSEKDFGIIRDIMMKLNYREWNSNALKKHITFIKDGHMPKDISLDGRCAVKFYRRMTDKNFGGIQYERVAAYVEEYNGYRVLNTEAALTHLIIHSHYYDFHPKVLADIYMICKNGNCNWHKVNEMVEAFGVERIASIVFVIMNKLGLSDIPMMKQDGDITFLADLYLSKVFWEKVFIRLNAEEMTKLRCYCFDCDRFDTLYRAILKDKQERRVSPMCLEFKIC